MTDLPIKTREIHSHHFDSTIWNDFKFRNDDIIISTYGKAGTTWMQQIIAQLLFGGDPNIEVAQMSPWMDLRVPPKDIKLAQVEAQTHRRFLKTHLPVDALRFSDKAKYIYIGRDARDVVWSMYNHHVNANQNLYDALNKTPGLVGAEFKINTKDIKEYWHQWFQKDGFPFWPFWENIRSWWEIRNLPNVMFIHFNDLKKDMPNAIRRIAAFLEVEISEENWPTILEYCSFNWMKKNAIKSVPLGGDFWDGGAKTFINQGVNGRWADTLSDADSLAYETRAELELGKECADWLKFGT